MSLDTGKRIHRFQWTVLPLTKAAKDRVEYIAEQQGQPLVASNFVYERSIDGEEVDDDENENEELDLEEWNEPQPPPAMLALEDNDGDDASTNSDVDDDVETGAEEVNNEMEEVQEAVVEDDNEQIEEREIVNDPDNDEVEREEVEEEASVYTTRSGRSTKKIDYSAMHKEGTAHLMQIVRKATKLAHGKIPMKKLKKEKKKMLKSIQGWNIMLIGAMMSQITQESKYA